MGAVVEFLRANLTFRELRTSLALGLIFRLSSISGSSLPWRSRRLASAPFYLLFVAARIWLGVVDRLVPEPYLDEVFHIPQGQKYCEGRFWDWDDKITTPPGLYLLSVAYHKLLLISCTPLSLRYNNVLAIVLVAAVALRCRRLLEERAAERRGIKGPHNISYAYYTGINIALFPVIFFFSGLYYTDVASTLVVLLCYYNHLHRLGPQPLGHWNDVWTVLLGVAALFMRQTNVFWVVVYMGGLEVVEVLRSTDPAHQGPLGKIHDPPLTYSGPEDWVLCVITLASTAIYNPMRVLKQIWPHITVLALFAGFVAWNGGVVLGDKSNHVATIHLAQMLYIWPLFAFFSAPLFIPSIISAVIHPLAYLQSLLSLTSFRSALIGLPFILQSIVISVAIVKYNTIIHPFTLADNRHYMFYVFRYTILRSPAIRLGLVAAYTLCRWLAWDSLSGVNQALLSNDSTPSSSPPSEPKLAAAESTASPATKDDQQKEVSAPTEPSADTTPASSVPPPTSTVLLLFLTTALSLVTAPLVEPRYFILPWVFYRLLVPLWRWGESGSNSGAGNPNKKNGGASLRDKLPAWMQELNPLLVCETVWFVAINLGTMYVFVTRPFCWRAPDGTLLDGGRTQRFMW